MVTPLARRRPTKLARETVTLDRLSGGRLTLGVGLGSDRFGHELSGTGEQTDDRVRARMLDEALTVLAAAWSGAPVRHRGDHYTVEDLRFLPRPVQPTGIPVWAAGFPGHRAPMRRAARLDGYFPVNLEHPDQLVEAVATITELRAAAGATEAPFDVVVALPAGTDPDPYVAAGATWWLTDFAPDAMSVDAVRGSCATDRCRPMCSGERQRRNTTVRSITKLTAVAVAWAITQARLIAQRHPPAARPASARSCRCSARTWCRRAA